MRWRKLWILCLVLMLALSYTSGATADMKKGKVNGSQYTNTDGLSLVIPKGFSFAMHQNKPDGFFRVVLGGKQDSKGWGPAIVVDILPGKKNVGDYTGRHLSQDLMKNPISTRYDKYTDAYVIGDRLFEEYDTMIRENLVVFRLSRFSETRVAFSYSYCFSTEKNFVRASYMCFGAQRTLTEDIPKFLELYNSLVVP